MKIVYIIPGSGGTFYCQNCMRDVELIYALRELGHDVVVAPMYLPLNVYSKQEMGDTPVFYGAINIYLKQLFPAFRKAPLWLERLLNSKPLLNLAAHFSGSTNAKGLEDMTVSMLQGEDGKQASELDQLLHWLKHVEKPDIVHLSNALLLGLAHRIKLELNVRLYCSLQDEHQWIDPMHADHREHIWQLMAEKAKDVDGFITVSRYYSEFMQKNMQLAKERITIVPVGINLQGYEPAPINTQPPVIGYLNRMSEMFGLEILLDAYILLKKKFVDLELHITGGSTTDDKPFIKRLYRKMNKAGVRNAVKIFPEFDRPKRMQFLRSLTVLSVPVPYGEAFGVYLIEALASGVPVVQPRVAAFPEFIKATQSGLLCEPNDAHSLADKINELLAKPDYARQLGCQGRKIVLTEYSIQTMAAGIIRAYEQIV